MKSRQTVHSLVVIVWLLCIQSIATSQNQLYLAEMPRVDRVLREIQGKDPADIAARQMAAFKQLRKIIESLAWNLDHRYMTRLTPNEKQISDAYEEAYARAWHAGPDKSVNNMHGLENDPQFRDELLEKFFSPNFRAMFSKSFVDEENRKKAKAQAEEDQMNQLRSQARIQHIGARNDPGTLQARRCAESGRDALKCTAEAMAQELKEGWIDPILGVNNTKAGLRINGIYQGAGFTTAFGHGMGMYSASVKCADLEPEQREYEIEWKNNQVVVRIFNDAGPISLVLAPNGNLVGTGSVTIKGQIIVGYTQQWVEERYTATNLPVPGSGHYVRVPIYKPKTARCTPGALIPKQVQQSNTPVAGIFSIFANLMGTDIDETPGLRLVGIFDGGPGINLEFHPDSGTVGCREAAVARKYVISQKGTDLLINFHGPEASVFSYLSDGTIRGPGTLTVSGRKVTNGQGPSSTGGVNYIGWTDTCTFSVLNPKTLGARLNLSPLSLAPPPKQSNGPANAILTLSSGFQENGPQPALRDRTILLVTDDFESILWEASYPPSPVQNLPAIAMWGYACEVNQQLCLQGSKEAALKRAAVVKLDANGQGAFPAVAAGTYYVVGQLVFNSKHYIWNYRIDLQPGQTSLKLTELNATLK